MENYSGTLIKSVNCAKLSMIKSNQPQSPWIALESNIPNKPKQEIVCSEIIFIQYFLFAPQESCHQNEMLKTKLAQIIHFLYDKEVINEDSIMQWHEDLDDDKEWIKSALEKLIAWLNESSEDESSEEEEDD